MSQNNEQRNTFVSLAEEISILNANNVEVLTKMNDVVTSNDATVQINYLNTNSSTTTYNLPTINYVQSEINTLNNNYNRLFSLNDNSVHLFQGDSTKKLYIVDLNREPNAISTLNVVSRFTPVDNWFFESLFNPLLTVKIDLSSQVDLNVEKVLSRRYMINFDKTGGGLSTQGQISYNSFNSQFLNKNNFTIESFLQWLTNPTNTGVINNTVPTYDEQLFEFDANTTDYFGYYTVLKQVTDTVNNKLWYILDNINIYDNTGKIAGQLKQGDEVILNRKTKIGNIAINFSNTRWIIKELSTAQSNGFSLNLERIEGYEPVPQNITNGLKLYSSVTVKKIVSVSVGVDEYDVVFLKPINTDSNLISSTWSKGVAFYTNSLALDTDSNKKLIDFYKESVLDFGTAVKQLAQTKKPRLSFLIPQPPVLNSTNFQVEQINKHQTDTDTQQKIQNLQSDKIQIQSGIDALNSSINAKRQEIYTTEYSSVDARRTAESSLMSMEDTLTKQTDLLKSKVDQLSVITSDSQADPKYRVRGFWIFPGPTSVPGYDPQETVQFKIRYKYKSLAGNDNPVNTYTLTDSGGTNINAYFSNWNQYSTEVRGRDDYGVWESEDIQNADKVNINQLDLPINPGESVEFQIKSISEAGWPDWPVESDWTDSITIDFPIDQAKTFNTTSDIQQQNLLDQQNVNFQDRLNDQGVTKHVSESYTDTNKYIAHLDTSIQTSFDLNGKYYDLSSYLTILTNKINDLEEMLANASGQLSISIWDGKVWTTIDNNSISSFNIECEDYVTSVDPNVPRFYYNRLYRIADYKIRLTNNATKNQLGLLSNWMISTTPPNPENTFYSGTTLATWVKTDNMIIPQQDNQFIYVSDNTDGRFLYGNQTTSGGAQYALNYKVPGTDYGYNLGYLKYGSGTIFTTNPYQTILTNPNPMFWNLTNNTAIQTGDNAWFLTTCHPVTTSSVGLTEIIDSGASKIHYLNAASSIEIPIYLYFKMEANSYTGVTIDMTSTAPLKITKSLAFFLKAVNATLPFNFEVQFNFIKYRAFNTTSA